MRSRGAVGNGTCGPDCPEAKALGAIASRKLPVEIAANFSRKVRRVREPIFVVGRTANCTTGRDAWSALYNTVPHLHRREKCFPPYVGAGLQPGQPRSAFECGKPMLRKGSKKQQRLEAIRSFGMFLQPRNNRPRETLRSAPCRSADDQFRLNRNFRNVFGFAFNKVDERLGGDLPHAFERLSNRGQARVVEGGRRDVVEAQHRHIFGNPQTRFLKGPDGANCGNIVVSEECSEGLLACQELFREGVTELGRGGCAVNLNSKLRANAKTKFTSGFTNRGPANGGVGARGMPFHESDLFVTQLREMCERESRREIMIQNNVGHPFCGAMAGHRDGGEFQLLSDGSVGGDETLDAARHQHLRVSMKKLGIVAVDNCKEEVIMLSQIFFDAADH